MFGSSHLNDLEKLSAKPIPNGFIPQIEFVDLTRNIHIKRSIINLILRNNVTLVINEISTLFLYLIFCINVFLE